MVKLSCASRSRTTASEVQPVEVVHRVNCLRRSATILRLEDGVFQILSESGMEIVSDVTGFEFDDAWVDAREIPPANASKSKSIGHPNTVHYLTKVQQRSESLEESVERQFDLLQALCSDPTSNAEEDAERSDRDKPLDLSSIGHGCLEVIADVTTGLAIIDGSEVAIRPSTHILGSLGNDRYCFSMPELGQCYRILAGAGKNELDLRTCRPNDLELDENFMVVSMPSETSIEPVRFFVEFEGIDSILVADDQRISLFPVPAIQAK